MQLHDPVEFDIVEGRSLGCRGCEAVKTGDEAGTNGRGRTEPNGSVDLGIGSRMDYMKPNTCKML